MRLGKRDWPALKYVLGRKETYTSLLRALTVLEQPVSLLRDEVFATSLRRDRIFVRTPLGRVPIRLNDPVDMSTVMGVFCREDYRLGSDAKVVVDIGANIGIASLYFLSRSADTFVYAYEPVARNIQTFRANVTPYADRCELVEMAVAADSGVVDFGVEPTGKFGGPASESESRIRVRCRSINDLIEAVLSKHAEIDCVKLDVEGMEEDLLSALRYEFWGRVRCIYAENSDSGTFMPPNFSRSFRYNVEKLTRW